GALRAVAVGAACGLFGHTAATAAEERQRRTPLDAAGRNADGQESEGARVGVERAATGVERLVRLPPSAGRAKRGECARGATRGMAFASRHPPRRARPPSFGRG